MSSNGRPLSDLAAQLDVALPEANIPILLMVLHQLTGDQRWMSDEFRPSRARGLTMNPSGGLTDAAQAEVRAAARRAILDWAAGRSVAVPTPSGETLAAMLSFCLGDEVDLEYAPLLAQEMGFAPATSPHLTHPFQSAAATDAIIIGAGVSGLGIAAALTRLGLEVRILERRHDLGGTWLDNRYPGVGVDTPSHLYAFSDFSYPWPSYFSAGASVHDYLHQFAAAHDLDRRIDFERSVDRCEWNDSEGLWRITSTGPDGVARTDTAQFLVSAVGQLSAPQTPDVPGREEFHGTVVHSAEWPADLEIDGKRVAVVGTGASAMQIVPAIVDRVDHLTVVQRSPQWIAPNEEGDNRLAPSTAWLLRTVPFYRAWFRAMLWWAFGDRIHDSLRVDPDWPEPERSVNVVNDAHRQFFTRFLEDKLRDRPDLIELTRPTYPPFGKRMLLDNGWFDALLRPNCELKASPLARFTPTGFETADGTKIDVEVIVLATGFDARRLLSSIDVVGRDGTTIRDVWGDDHPSAYLGMTVPRFPNLFVLYGPNTNLGHGGSYIFLAECQIQYVVDLITQLADTGHSVVEVREKVHEAYNQRVDEAHELLVWRHPSVDTWYRNSSGRVVTNSPWKMIEFWQLTRHADLGDFELRSGPTPG
jgi:4-hydroxyacetophenone monooxygenase